MCVWGQLFCTRAFLTLMSHGMKIGTTTAALPRSVWWAGGHYLPCCRRAEQKGLQEAMPMQRHRLSDLPVPPRSPPTAELLLLLFLFPWKSIFPSFSLGWATAGAFHISAQLANFPVLFFLPRVSVQRVVHPDVLPWLALSPDSPEVRAERSKRVRERPREQKLTKQWGRCSCIIKKVERTHH